MRRRLLGLVAVWILLTGALWGAFFVRSEAGMVVAGHDAVVRPTLDHQVRIETGPYLPDLRMPSDGRIGVRIAMGKTTAQSTNELIERYALIAGNPDVEVRAVAREVKALALDAALRSGLVALVPVLGWVLLGRERRHQLRRPSRRGLAVTAGVVLFATFVAWQPWRPHSPRLESGDWITLQEAVPDVTVPADLRRVEVQGNVLTQNTETLIRDAFGYYDRSTAFYRGLVDLAPEIADRLHRPTEGQTVAVLVSDRHDNIGMDPVVRTVADLAGATAVIDAGDDTSAGQEWEAFSLESLDDAFSDFDDRIVVTGNHDHGGFVADHLERRGWTHLDHSVAEKFGVRFFGVDDPRSSGLGAFIPVDGPTFGEEKETLADEVCELDEKGERVATLVVHDANMGRTALDRGCVDLIVAGHTHVQVGPEQVLGDNGRTGWTFTNGTTGGAAFAVAVGGKLRREAQFTFVTYADGVPVGLQPVKVSTNGVFTVDPYIDLGIDPEVSPATRTD